MTAFCSYYCLKKRGSRVLGGVIFMLLPFFHSERSDRLPKAKKAGHGEHGGVFESVLASYNAYLSRCLIDPAREMEQEKNALLSRS
ncbi:hypothetical protein CH262_13885 [Rhodococcus sp. 05-2255-1e]|uniref:hypothetical protein n=1 Tax=Rhodococcus sp. 05-2255-1e TaxID=2022495 RepID=UPI000B9C1240|nr:hypothetical protein [Rhodococcus sp. 05-2255-1e]OZE24545.1 hypothetical protein CH262_13885 [Rhodococcus sp. 05-2255-1e]